MALGNAVRTALEKFPGGPELLRFLAVAVAGLVVDLSISWSLAVLGGLSLGVAAICGFAVASVVNYVLHELWTFQDGARQMSLARAGKYLFALGITLAVRLVMIALLTPLFSNAEAPLSALVILVVATGVSFVANYLASKFLVFRAAPTATQEK